MAGELRRPNGIVLSRDEKLLYVADSDAESFYVFDVQPGGTAADRREFAHLAEITRSYLINTFKSFRACELCKQE
jgi:sugar lactone lactonase YvrE